MAIEVRTQDFADFFKGKPPQSLLYEDEHCVAFNEEDNIQAPIHFLVVPKKVIPRLSEASVEDEKLLGHLLIVARRVAKDLGLAKKGFRVVMNEGKHSWHLLLVVKKIAIQKGLTKHGYHVVVDENHHTVTLNSLHVFGRALHHMLWPVGPGARL